MSPIWLLILVLIVLLVLGTAIFLYFVLKRSRRVTFSADPAVRIAADKKEPPPGEFLNYSSNVDLRASFSRALRLLKTYVTGKDYRYRVPWFLMTGESESGKTTILDNSGINLSANGSGADNQLNWYFFNEGVVIDVAGDFVLRADGTANHRGWNTISRLLQKHRPRRPLDGLVLTIPCTDLIGPDEFGNESRFRLEQKATCLYRKLWQSQRVLGMRLPVYVLVTKCDEVTGFTGFCNQLPENLQTQMFGWSNPLTLETAYKTDFVPEAFESLHKYLSRLQFEIYAERDEIQDADDVFLFPSAMQSMRAPLQVYLDGLFKQSAYHESFFFRGLYFCGQTPDESLAGPAQTSMVEHWTTTFEPSDTSLPEAMEPATRKPIFVADLFKEKIFGEDFLAQPIKRIALARNRTVLAAQILSLLIIVVGAVGLTAAYVRLSRQESTLYAFLKDEQEDLKRVQRYQQQKSRQPANLTYRLRPDNLTTDAESTDSDRQANHAYLPVAYTVATDAQPLSVDEQMLNSGEANLLKGMAEMNGNPFDSFFIPSSWFSTIDEDLQTSITTAFKFVIFDSLKRDLEKRANGLLEVSTTPSLASADPTSDRNQIPGSGSSDSSTRALGQDFRLPLFVEKVGELRLNMERYDRIIKKDSGSLDDLKQLVEYLKHQRLPAGFDKDNVLYKQAFYAANGDPINEQVFFKALAAQVADSVDDLYRASFNKNVKYSFLDEITATEALLRRPEYTWLATQTFKAESPFAGMTIASGLIKLRFALQDLRRQRFMAEDAPDASSRYQRRYQHRVRNVLVWDQEVLSDVLALSEQYETFVSARSYEHSDQVENSVKAAARAQAKLKIRKLIMRARKYEALVPSNEGSALRASLITEIQSLQMAKPILTQVLEVSGRLGIDRELRAMLAEQGNSLLRNIQREFVSSRFYAARQGDFAWWQGIQPVSYHAFDLGSSEDLELYLNVQRKSIAYLGRDLVVPIEAFFASQGIPLQRGVQADWDGILADLDAYENKTPGNPISALETFIRTEMDRVSVDHCTGIARVFDDRSSDYFLRIRNSLRQGFYARCTELGRSKAIIDTLTALENYRKIEQSFNDNLRFGFPFGDVNGPQIDPPSLTKFFDELDLREKAAREALDRSEGFGALPERARVFLKQAVKAREFFAPFLEKKQGPVFDFKLQFRIQPELPGQAERGGNQIIDWQLEVGKKNFAYRGEDLTGRWVYGDPIRLTLRWANDSPARPMASLLPVPFVVKERTAIFEYNDRWALFTFLLKHGLMLKRAGTQAECDQGLDPDPYTLKFTIRTGPDPAGLPGQRQDLQSTSAEVFMRVTMLTANKPEPLMIPCFPVKAPPVPSLFVVDRTTATNKDK